MSADTLPGSSEALPDVPDDLPPLIGDDPPKRGRGRPPGSRNKPKGAGGSSSPTASPKRPTWARATAVEAYLNEVVALASTALIFVNREDSRIIAEGGPRIVHELVELAKTEPALRRYLEMSAAPGKYGPLLVALAGVLIPIAVNHNLIPTIAAFTAGGEN